MVTVPNFTLSPGQLAVRTLHDKPEEYGQRLKLARADRTHRRVRRLLLDTVTRTDRVADFGVGDGFVGRVLHERQHLDMVFGCDISEANLQYVKSQRTYDQVWLATAHDFCRQMALQATMFEWVTLISVVYYLSPEELAELLALLAPITRKGVILTIDAIPASLRTHLATSGQGSVATYCHMGAWSPEKSGFHRSECVWCGTGWSHSSAKINVPVELWLLRKEPVRLSLNH
jgi:2-polyprenyl-3-methyl-5-hydroxy-6-metoxy-1,4-benzoquinol methylase